MSDVPQAVPYTEASVESFANKLAQWAGALTEQETALLWSILARASAAGEQDVQGYGNYPPLRIPSFGFSAIVFDACGIRPAAPEAPRGGGRSGDVPS